MANFKVVISDPKTKKAYQKEMDQGASGILQKRIGEKLRGDSMGLTGYELQITGGSDRQGFPMRKDVEGMARKKILITVGTGFRTKVRGKRKRKSIRGNTVSTNISQVNVKVIGYGSKPIEQLLGATEKKLQEEISGKVEEKAPEKSVSEKILEEKAAKEKGSEKGEEEKKPAEAEKSEEPSKEEAAETGEQAKPAEEPAETGDKAKEPNEEPAEKPEKEEKPAEPEAKEEKPKEEKK